MKKIIVIGCPGAGKTTFSEKLSRATGIPLFHLDAVWHKADRTHITRDEFDERLARIMSREEWIIDGDYSRTLEARMAECDTVFLFDLPVEVCLEGATARLGKKRVDMPWIDTELDPRLHAEIESFRESKLPTAYSLIEKYRNGKSITVFYSRSDADKYLSELVPPKFLNAQGRDL